MRSEDLFAGIGAISDRWLTEADTSEGLALATKRRKRKNQIPAIIAYEMKKILSVRYLWIFFLAMLLINSAIAWMSVKSDSTAAENRMIAEFVEGYFENPEEYAAHYEKLLAFNEEQIELMKEAMAAGNADFVPEKFPNVYSTSDRIPDELLFRALQAAIESAQEFPKKIQSIVDNARLNLESLPSIDADDKDYVSRYQRKVIELYGELLENTRIGVEYTRGWENYFNYGVVNFFIAGMILMISALVFAQEKQNGFLTILRTTPEGRMTTAMGKLLTLMIVSALTVAVFTLSTFAIFGMKIGYSSPLNSIQAIPGFALTPYRITVGGYFLLSVGIKMLAFFLLGFAVAAVSVIFSNYAVIFISGFALWTTNFLLYSNLPQETLLGALNLASLADTSGLFAKFRSLNLLGIPCSYLSFALVVSSILILSFAAFCTAIHTRGFVGIRFSWIDRFQIKGQIAFEKIFARFSRRSTRKRKKLRSFSGSLISAELFKSLISSRFIVALVLILLAKVMYSTALYSAPKSYTDQVYYEYMTQLEGELTEEKAEWIRSEREAMDSVLRQKEEMQSAYRNGTIDFNEYCDYLSRYNYAQSRKEPLQIIENHAEYLAEKNNGGWFLYDTGWQKLYCGDADLFLYTAILLLLAGIFSAEYFTRGEKNGFIRILRSTKKGREKTFSAKLISAAIIALTLTLLTSAIDTFTIFANYKMPALSAPIVSIREFAALSPTLTVGEYLAVFLILRIVGALLMAMLVCALSELLCRYLPVLGTVILLTLLPAFCAGFGIRAAEPLNFLNLFSGTPLLLGSAEASLFGSDWGMLAIWITVTSAAVGGVLIPARKTYVKGRYL